MLTTTHLIGFGIEAGSLAPISDPFWPMVRLLIQPRAGDSVPTDYSGRHTLSGPVSLQTSLVPWSGAAAIEFDSDSDSLDPSGAMADFSHGTADPFCLEMVFRLTRPNPQPGQVLLDTRMPSLSEASLIVDIAFDNSNQIVITHTGGSLLRGGSLQQGVWHVLIYQVWHDGSQHRRLALDGTLIASEDGGNATMASSGRFRIGGNATPPHGATMNLGLTRVTAANRYGNGPYPVHSAFVPQN